MPRRRSPHLVKFGLLTCVLAAAGLMPHGGAAQQTGATATVGGGPPPSQPSAEATHSLGNDFQQQKRLETYTAANAEALLNTPASGLHPGGVVTAPKISNPVAGNPDAVERGKQYFKNFNCIGCHAPNGGGGMGRALSNRFFEYGSEPAQIYITIAQGRPNGMPAWGTKLPADVIWDLVAYVEQISKAPVTEWGTTISAKSPSLEQVPAEFLSTVDPWSYTEPFSYGQRPEGRNGKK